MLLAVVPSFLSFVAPEFAWYQPAVLETCLSSGLEQLDVAQMHSVLPQGSLSTGHHTCDWPSQWHCHPSPDVSGGHASLHSPLPEAWYIYCRWKSQIHHLFGIFKWPIVTSSIPIPWNCSQYRLSQKWSKQINKSLSPRVDINCARTVKSR